MKTLKEKDQSGVGMKEGTQLGDSIIAGDRTGRRRLKMDDRITNVDRADRMSHSASVGVLNWHGKFKEMLARAHQNESIAVRQAKRIEELERRVELLIDESDTGRLDDVDNRLDDLECSVEEKVDSCDVDDKVELALSAQDLPDVYSIEAMIQTKVMDAVREEIDATDFKITVER